VPPDISTHPQSQTVLAGTNLAGATSISLLLTNVQLEDMGDFTVVVPSPYGSVNSDSIR